MTAFVYKKISYQAVGWLFTKKINEISNEFLNITFVEISLELSVISSRRGKHQQQQG